MKTIHLIKFHTFYLIVPDAHVLYVEKEIKYYKESKASFEVKQEEFKNSEFMKLLLTFRKTKINIKN